MTVARVALPVATDGTFDYWVPAGIAATPGAVVRVRLARRAMTGVVVDIGATSEVAADRLHPIGEVLSEIPPLPADVLDLARFVSGYYQEPLGRVLAQALPPIGARTGVDRAPADAPVAMRLTESGRAALAGSFARASQAQNLYERWERMPDGVLQAADIAALPATLRRTVRAWRDKGFVAPTGDATAPQPDRVVLNADQRAAVAAIGAAHGGFAPFLLQGVTGSGKTDVYLEAARACIAAGGQALLLVPEINLTPQFAQRIADALPGHRAVTLHSRLAAGERRRNWRLAASGEADLVLGTRLAVFAPLPRLGLIVIDEEHDPSFKQQDGVRYHGRDVAVWRARQRGVPVVLGTATPSLESLLQAQRERYRWLRLTERAIAPARLPACRFVSDKAPGTVEGISAPLVDAIESRLARGEQSLLFVNRRGFAPSLSVRGLRVAGGVPPLQRATGRAPRRSAAALPPLRPRRTPAARAALNAATSTSCRSATARSGWSARLTDRFPAARIARIDRDSTQRKGAFAGLREQVEAGSLDILVGTQMLAKGHDFPRLTLVGVRRRRQRAVQRGFPRNRAACGAALPGRRTRGPRGASGRSHRPDGLSRARRLSRAGSAGLREFRRHAVRRAPRRGIAAVRAPRAARARRRPGVHAVDAFLAAAHEQGRALIASGASRGRGVLSRSGGAGASRRRRARAGRGAERRSRRTAALPAALARCDRGNSRAPGALVARRRPAGVCVMIHAWRHAATAGHASSRGARRNAALRRGGISRQAIIRADRELARRVPRQPVRGFVADSARSILDPMTDVRTRIASWLAQGLGAVAPGENVDADHGRAPEAGGARRLRDQRRVAAREGIATQSARIRAGAGGGAACVRPRCAHRNRRRRIHQHLSHSLRHARPSCRRSSPSATHYGRSGARSGERVMVEFVSANPTGPLHVGHGRQAALGDALANLLQWQGADVTREYYYNDAGAQIQNLAVSVRARAQETPGGAHDISGGRLSRRIHSRARAAVPRRSRARSRRHRSDTPLRRGGIAQGAGRRSHGVRRSLRQLLSRELALYRTAGSTRRLRGSRLRAAPTRRKARCG